MAVKLLLLACLASPDDWPAFRGPAGNGLSAEKRAPTAWGPDAGIVWKTPLPRPGNGSPIVSAGRVFVAGSEDAEGTRRTLSCFDRKDGRLLWTRTVEFGKKMPMHDTNTASPSTPAADGTRVVVWHDSAGLYCYDFEGKELWKRDLGEFRHMWGHGGSPVLHDGKVILNCGPGKRNFMTALALADGKTLWEREEPYEGDGDRNAGGQYRGSWCTPVVAEGQILCIQPTRLVAYAPADGAILWASDGVSHPKGDLAYSSPVVVGDICAAIGGFNGPALGVRRGGQRLWRTEKSPQSIGSGIAVDGLVYAPMAGPNIIQCIDPADGKVLWQERTDGAFWGSVVQAADRLYVTDQGGTTLVFTPNRTKLEVVASNRLGESCNATPAISDGRIFIRTFKHLWCIGE